MSKASKSIAHWLSSRQEHMGANTEHLLNIAGFFYITSVSVITHTLAKEYLLLGNMKYKDNIKHRPGLRQFFTKLSNRYMFQYQYVAISDACS